MTGCTILGCGRTPIAAKGMCWGHYRRDHEGKPVFVYLRLKRGNGRVSAVPFGPARPTLRQRKEAAFRTALKECITPEPNTGCWLWLGCTLGNFGYGRVGSTRDAWGGYAHRAVLYFQGVGLERGNYRRHVRHLCDQPACVNPAHLVYGTAQENMQDRERHGRGLTGTKCPSRGRPGETHPRAKLTAEQVAQIRARLAGGEIARTIAPDFGVSVPLIYSIKGGYVWRGVAASQEAA